MKNNMTTRGLVESALMTAIATILVLLGVLPFVGLFFLLFCSIPITVVTIRQGAVAGGLAAGLTTLLIGLFLGPLAAISSGLQYLLLGWVLGYMLLHRKSGSKTLQATVLTAMLTAIVTLLINLGLMGFTPASITAYMNDYNAEMMEFYQTSGVLDMMTDQGLSKEQVIAMLEQSLSMVFRIMPAFVILSRSMMALVTYFFTAQVLKRLKIRIPRVQNFQKWSLPAASVWGLIVVWALWLFSDSIQIPWLDVLSLNLLIICGAFLFLDGLALSSYWFKFNEMSTPMKVVGTIFILFFFTGFLVASILMGLADLLFDFRKLRVDNKKVTKDRRND